MGGERWTAKEGRAETSARRSVTRDGTSQAANEAAGDQHDLRHDEHGEFVALDERNLRAEELRQHRDDGQNRTDVMKVMMPGADSPMSLVSSMGRACATVFTRGPSLSGRDGGLGRLL